ncbi:type VII secretion protein EccB [Krasilnikovia cinnamomea]|uniref:Type VII secretion protein EccB n=1 Tax=Krasilnikovia cinnamomea TaxID=349313 RepID=A0A4Q7ZKP8_9ACTN|nr:type VII secretion protein EccB [Krasilnikovia cinnamomea]RZU51121.1 type VII secretion protein EccB [Krasilnikovia cinnamomea]
MPSRQDQLHSYQYSLQRVVAALVTHDPDPHRSPLRRAGTTALVSLVIAAVAVGAAAVYGLITGRSNENPRNEAVVFLEKGSGARYVYLKADDQLHPVLNYASGLLIANSSAPELRTTTRKRLAAVPLGAPLGIPDAPDSLPDAGDLLVQPWSICTQPPDAADKGPRSTLLVGDRLTGGTVAASPGAGGPAQGLLVRDPDDRLFLVSGNRRFRIPRDRVDVTLGAFEWSARQRWPVAPAWINSIPLGADMRPLSIDGRGERSGVPDAEIGRLLTDGKQWKVALADGAAPITEVQAKLLLTVEGTTQTTLDGPALINLPPSGTRLIDAGDPNALPSTLPALTDPARSACMTLPLGGDGTGLRIDPSFPAGSPANGPAAVSGGVQADWVHVARGRGAVVMSQASPTAPAGSGTVSIVTDTGRRYPVTNREVLGKLGYGGVSPQSVPAQLVALLPQGPALDVTRARQTGSGDAQGG